MSQTNPDPYEDRIKEFSTCPVCCTQTVVPQLALSITTHGTAVTINCTNCKLSWKVLVGARIQI